MAIAIDPRDRREYVLKDERGLPVEQQTVFMLKHLTERESAQVGNELSNAQGATGMHTAVRYGLVDWRNFKDAKGKDVPFPSPNEKMSPLDRLSTPIRMELATEILGTAKITEEDLGK